MSRIFYEDPFIRQSKMNFDEWFGEGMFVLVAVPPKPEPNPLPAVLVIRKPEDIYQTFHWELRFYPNADPSFKETPESTTQFVHAFTTLPFSEYDSQARYELRSYVQEHYQTLVMMNRILNGKIGSKQAGDQALV